MLISVTVATISFCLWWFVAKIAYKIKLLRRKPFACEYCFPLYVFAGFYFLPSDVLLHIAALFFSAFLVTLILKAWDL